MIRNGQIVDNLSLINQALKQERSGQGKSSKNDKIYPTKKRKIKFSYKEIGFKNAYAQVISEDLKINTNTRLSNMEFLNVGNTKNANHFKDVVAMILTNVVSKVQNDVLKQKIKQKFESKLKDILNKNILGGQGVPNQKGDKKNILNDLLKGNKDDLLKNLINFLNEDNKL